jgi:EmrB/QacA subfamily drug resistance transporter
MDTSETLAEPILPTYGHADVLRVLGGIVLSLQLAALDQTAVIPAVPAMARDFHDYDHLAWVVSAYLLTSTAATPIVGKLSDTYGRRALMIPSIALFMVASVLCATSSSLTQLILWRGLQGIGGGGLFAMAQAALADVVAPRDRGRYQGYLAANWTFASIAGPVIGGYVTDGLSWRWLFWANLPLGLLAIFLCHRALKIIVVVPRRSRIDVLGAILLTGGVSALLLMLSFGDLSSGRAVLTALGWGALGICLLWAFLAHERRALDPLLPPRLLGNDVVRCGALIAFFSSLGFFAGILLLPLDFQLLQGYGAGTSGLLVVPYLAASTAGSYLSGSLARRIGKSKGLILAGLIGGVVSFALLGVTGGSTAPTLIVIESALLGATVGMCMPMAIVVVQNAVERRDIGAATGITLLLRALGSAFGSTLAGSLVALRFNGALRAHGVHHAIDLGSLSHASSAIAGMPAELRRIALAGLSSGFVLAYWVSALLLVLAVCVALKLRDVPLRSATIPPPPLD